MSCTWNAVGLAVAIGVASARGAQAQRAETDRYAGLQVLLGGAVGFSFLAAQPRAWLQPLAYGLYVVGGVVLAFSLFAAIRR